MDHLSKKELIEQDREREEEFKREQRERLQSLTAVAVEDSGDPDSIPLKQFLKYPGNVASDGQPLSIR